LSGRARDSEIAILTALPVEERLIGVATSHNLRERMEGCPHRLLIFITFKPAPPLTVDRVINAGCASFQKYRPLNSGNCNFTVNEVKAPLDTINSREAVRYGSTF
jgi:hypothetical protein